jgi:hypothetical protein
MAFVVLPEETMDGWNWMVIRRVQVECKAKVVIVIPTEEPLVECLSHLGWTHV